MGELLLPFASKNFFGYGDDAAEDSAACFHLVHHELPSNHWTFNKNTDALNADGEES